MLQGWKTIILGLLMVIAPSALSYLAGINWNTIVGGTAATVISGVIMIAMRFVTTTPVGTKS